MLRLFFGALVLFSAGMLNAQSVVTNSGINFSVATGTVVTITGDYTATAAHTLSNSGTIEISRNWTNNTGTSFNFPGLVRWNGTTDGTLGGSQPTVFTEWAVNKTAGNLLLGSGGHTVNGNIHLTNGDIVLGDHNLIIGSSGTISGTPGSSSYFHTEGNGLLQKNFSAAGAFTFPIGDEDEYSPFTITVHSAAFSGNDFITAKVVDGAHPSLSTNNMITRWWRLNSGGFSSINYDVSYNYTDGDVTGDESRIFAGLLSSGNPNRQYNPADAAMNVLRSSAGITAAPANHDFVGADGKALPVSLLTFNVTRQKEGAMLHWTTTSESDNDYFLVERSLDGRTFNAIGKVEGADAGSQRNVYTFMDKSLLSHTVFYRLRQVDRSAAYSLSHIIRLQLSEHRPSSLCFIQNRGFLVLKQPGLTGHKASVFVYTASGALIISQTLAISGGTLDALMPLPPSVQQGPIIVRVQGMEQVFTYKVLHL